MISRIMITVFVFLLFFITFGASEQEAAQISDATETSVSLSAFVEEKRVPLNRSLIFTVQISWMGDLDLIKIGELEEPVLSNFEIVGTSSANRVSGVSGGKKAVKEITYTLLPTTLGMGYIESVGLSYEDMTKGKTHHLMTQRIGVEVTSPVAEEGESRKLWIWIVVAAVMISGFCIFFIIVKARSTMDKGEVEIQRIIEKTYLDELKETVDFKGGDRREAFTILTKLFRRYLSEKYDIATLEATTEQLIDTLRQEALDEGLIQRCETLFKKADVVKFSGQEATSSELEEGYTTVETILESHLAQARKKMLDLEAEKSKKRRIRLTRRTDGQDDRSNS